MGEKKKIYFSVCVYAKCVSVDHVYAVSVEVSGGHPIPLRLDFQAVVTIVWVLGTKEEEPVLSH